MSDVVASFRAAVESGDIEAVPELLAEDIVFHSPVTFHPYTGRDTVSQLLEVVFHTFEDFRYVDELEMDGGHALIFRTAVGGRELEGIDIFRLDEQGLIGDFTVMLRPLSGLVPFAQVMAEKVGAIGLESTRA
jgi:hypothetical protein